MKNNLSSTVRYFVVPVPHRSTTFLYSLTAVTMCVNVFPRARFLGTVNTDSGINFFWTVNITNIQNMSSVAYYLQLCFVLNYDYGTVIVNLLQSSL